MKMLIMRTLITTGHYKNLLILLYTRLFLAFADMSRCFKALEAALLSAIGSPDAAQNASTPPSALRLRGVDLRSFEIHVIEKDELPVCSESASRPCLAVLCRRSDESAAVDTLFEPHHEFPSVLAAGGKGLFTQPSANQGVIHVIEDRLPCEDAYFSKALDDLLAHEMTHAGDALVHKIDLRVCGYLACSEVRAAAQGECWKPPFLQTRRGCTRTAARGSTDMAFPGAGREAVDAVFDTCFSAPPTSDPSPMLPDMRMR